MKKMLSIATTFVLVFSMAPFTALADNSCVSFDANTGVLTLSGNVKKEEVLAFSENEKVLSVVATAGTVMPADCSGMFYAFSAKNRLFTFFVGL